MLPFVIAYTYFTMMGTSMHVIAKLLVLRREQLISTKQLVIHGLLQIVFTLDVFDCIYLAIKQKKIEQTFIPQI